jgi:DNA topoisomerase-3
MSQTDEGKWRVEFNELWAKEGAKAPEAEEASGDAASASTPAAAREEEKRSAA